MFSHLIVPDHDEELVVRVAGVELLLEFSPLLLPLLLRPPLLPVLLHLLDVLHGRRLHSDRGRQREAGVVGSRGRVACSCRRLAVGD